MKKVVPSYKISKCEECPYHIGGCHKVKSKRGYCSEESMNINSWDVINKNFPDWCPLNWEEFELNPNF